MKRPLLIAALLLICQTAAMACPYCKDAAPTSATDTAASPLFNTSIYFMLGGLFAVMSLVLRTILRGVKSSQIKEL